MNGTANTGQATIAHPRSHRGGRSANRVGLNDDSFTAVPPVSPNPRSRRPLTEFEAAALYEVELALEQTAAWLDRTPGPGVIPLSLHTILELALYRLGVASRWVDELLDGLIAGR
jgi:hypothetical protein